ncbi:MAG: hypothetical protein K2P78_04170 [Gemmataceae bacterium]|nr:hypothetical protein [Gemmataceae bacterium]
MALDWYVGPWQWRDAPGPSWNPPPGFAGLDLRSLPDHAQGTAGLGLFFGLNQSNPGSDYTPLGSGPWGSIQPTARQLSAIPRRSGFAPTGTTLRAVVASLLTDGSDPDGLDFARPLLPTSQMTLELHAGGSVLSVPFAWGGSHTNLIRTLIRKEFAALWQAEQDARRDFRLSRKVLGALCLKYRIGSDQWREFVPPALQGDVPGPLPPETTITESFDKADGAGLGPDLTWTEVSGAWRTDGNRGGKSANTGAVQLARADADLSSADHYAQAKVVLNSTYGGPACRCPSAATMTFYVAFAGSPAYIAKFVAGTQTNLTTGGGTTTNDVLQIRANGSTISARVNGSQILTTTDTSIAGNLRCGLELFYATAGNFEDFQAADLITGYTLTAAAGSFVYTGQAAGLRATRVVSAGAGAFTLTGNAAGLVVAAARARRFACNGRGPFGFDGDGDAPGFTANGRGSPRSFVCNEGAR